MANGDRLNFAVRPYNGNVKLKYYGPKTVEYIYDIKQACAFCECSPDTIRRWIEIGQLPAFKTCENEEVLPESALRGRLYFLKSDLINALRISLGVPAEGFNVEDYTRNRHFH